MTTQTTTLADFLLARIAEQRADVEQRGTFAVGHAESCIFEGGYEGTSSCDCGAVARVLADCEARRRIVEMAEPETPDDLDRYSGDFGTGWTWAHADVLAALASVYESHSDFDEAWLL